MAPPTANYLIKGTSNEKLTLENKFVEIYDCKQYRREYTDESR